MPVYPIQPTLDTSLYATGDNLDTILVLKGALAAEGLLVSIEVYDADNEGIQIDFMFFDSAPTGTYTKNSAAAIDAADISKVIGHASVLSTEYITIGTDKKGRTTAPPNILLPAKTTGDLHVLAIARGGPTFAAATDLTFKFGVLRS